MIENLNILELSNVDVIKSLMRLGVMATVNEIVEFDVAAKVMKDKQHQNYKSKKGKVMVDMQSANLLTQVSKKAKPQVIKFLSDLGHKNPNQLMRTL